MSQAAAEQRSLSDPALPRGARPTDTEEGTDMKTTLKRMLTMLLALALCVMCFACATAEGEQPTLRIGTTTAQTGFSIVQDGLMWRMSYNNFVNLSMFRWDENNQMQPNFITDWEFADDGMSMTFHFQTGLYWHDGEPVTAEDVKFSLEYTKEKLNASTRIESCEILDDNTLRVVFTAPAGLQELTGMSSTGNAGKVIMPKHIWENVDDPDNYSEPDAIIGCGPYRFVSRDEDAQISFFEAVDYDYPLGDLAIKKVSIKTYDSNDALLMAINNDEIDAIYNYSNPCDPNMLDVIVANPDVNPGQSIHTGNYMINFGCENKPCDDVSFRQAVAYALDYELMAQVTDGEYGQVGSLGIIPPANKAFDGSIPRLAKDAEKAAQILDEAGYLDVDGDGIREMPDGSPMDVMVTINSTVLMEMYGRIYEIMEQDLGDIGVKIHLDEEAMTNNEILTQRRNDSSQCEISLVQCTTGVAPFGSAYRYLLSSSSLAVGTNPDEIMNEAYQAAMSARDYDTYIAQMQIVQQRNTEVVAGIPIAWSSAFFPYRTDRFEGFINYPGWGVINNSTWYAASPK